MLRLWLRGALAGELDGQPIAMPSSERGRALIAWLALHPGSRPRLEAATCLWPDAAESSARANLRTAIWAVREAWGPAAELLESSRLTIGLAPRRTWVDVYGDELDRDRIDAVLLPGLDDDWVQLARQDDLSRRLTLLRNLADLADHDGRSADAVRLSRDVCRLAPLDEAAHRSLLNRLLQAGDRASATIAARAFSELLREELGVRPSPATRAVQAQVAANSSGAPRAPLFGRAAELRTLSAVWQAARNGAGQVVLLTGEAGIGKTSVLGELSHRVGIAGGRTAIGAGVDVGGETPFAAWLELAKSLVTTVSRVPAGASWPIELNRLAPELGARLGRPDPPPAVTAPELERLRIFESVLRLVEWACVDRPTLIALDDAHRVDSASLRLTAHVGRRIGQLPLLLVLTRRDRPTRPELDAVLAELVRRSVPITEIDLAPIDDTAVAALASSLLSSDDELVRRVIASAEGNPLLAVETTRVFAAGGSGPPPNLRTAVRATAGALPAPAQTLIGLLAVAGRPLSRDELDRLAVPELASAEQAALAEGLLVRREGRLGFRHGLLRESVYADLPDPAALHDQIVGALDPFDRAEIAHHLALAGRDVQAAEAWATAAVHARSVGALAEAADFLVRATALAPNDGRLWLELGEVSAWQGRQPETEAAWSRTVELLPAAELADAWSRRGRQFRSVVCHPQASLHAYREAAALLVTESSIRTRADVLIGLAWGEAVAGDPLAAEENLSAAEAILTADQPAETRADIAETRMQGLIRQGRFAAAVEVARVPETATAVALLPERAYAVWINAACALTCVGDYDGALEMADRAITGTEAVPVLLAGSLAARAHILSRLGRHEDARITLVRQRDCVERLDAPSLAAVATHDAGLVALAAGRYSEAAALLGEALDAGADVSRPTAGLLRAEAFALSGQADAANRQLRAAILEPVGRADQPRTLVPRIAWIQGLIAAARGDEALARRRFDEAEREWRALLKPASDGLTADAYMANLVDLGRPPVVGLVEPAREIVRIERARHSFEQGLLRTR
jgi:DNA-binding SARP family transcriptional activator/tetratricopeptide (TPR) repeat protein